MTWSHTKCIESDSGYILQSKPKFLWIIEEISTVCKTFAEYILSPDFLCGNKIETLWKLRFFPYGMKEGDSSKLCFMSHDHIYFDIERKKGLKDIPDLNNFFSMEFMFGKTRSTNLDNFLKKIKNPEKAYWMSLEIPDLTFLNKFLSDIRNPKFNALNDIGQLYINKTLCDVTIKVSGEEFKVHKAILAARSKVFAAMFEHDMIEKKTSSVEIEDIDHEVLEALLKFIYTGEVEIKEIVQELLMAADKYEISDLKDICVASLNYSLNIDNAIDLLMYSEFYYLNELKANIIDFIMNNYKDIVNKPSFKSLEQAPQLLTELNTKMASISET